MRLTASAFALSTMALWPRRILRLALFLVRIWRRFWRRRRNLPLPVTSKRLAADFFVFILGMALSSSASVSTCNPQSRIRQQEKNVATFCYKNQAKLSSCEKHIIFSAPGAFAGFALPRALPVQPSQYPWCLPAHDQECSFHDPCGQSPVHGKTPSPCNGRLPR